MKLTHELPASEQAHEKREMTPEEPTVNDTELPCPTQVRGKVDLDQVNAFLSNERTFLAWIWTGMLLMGFGVGIAKMRITITDFAQFTGALMPSGEIHQISPVMMGLLFLFVGLMTIFISTYRYLVVQNQLRNQTYTSSDNFVLVFLLALTLLSCVLFLFVLQLR